MNSIKLPYVKVTYGGASYISDPDSVLAEIRELLDELTDGETVILKRVDITTAELEALPEFEGW